MRTRSLVIGLAVSSMLASSCASTARAAFLDIYHDEAGTSQVAQTCGDTSFAPLPGGPCDGVDLNPSVDDPSKPVDDIDSGRPTNESFGQTAADAIFDSKDFSCAHDKRVLETAVEMFYATYGDEPTAMIDLVEFGIIGETDRWAFEIPDDDITGFPAVTPIPGGPCDG